jgi:hypothetical protein
MMWVLNMWDYTSHVTYYDLNSGVSLEKHTLMLRCHAAWYQVTVVSDGHIASSELKAKPSDQQETKDLTAQYSSDY